MESPNSRPTPGPEGTMPKQAKEFVQMEVEELIGASLDAAGKQVIVLVRLRGQEKPLGLVWPFREIDKLGARMKQLEDDYAALQADQWKKTH
jgi:hypothetical protein